MDETADNYYEFYIIEVILYATFSPLDLFCPPFYFVYFMYQ